MQAEPPVVLFVNELRHYNKSAVCPGILTGGKGQDLVAVFGGYADIVKRQFLALLYIGSEILGGLRINELIVFEAIGTVRINHGFEHGNHFIGLSVGQRIKGYCAFPKSSCP